MKTWNFYLSGILYGKIDEEEGAIFVRRLDPETGKLCPRASYGETDEVFFAGLCSRSLREFFQHRREYEEQIAGRPESFTTKGGEVFSRRRQDSYIQRRRKFPKDLFYGKEGIYAVCMSGRDYAAVLVLDGFEQQTVLKKWSQVYPEISEGGDGKKNQPAPVHPVRFLGTFFVPTRDGERLATDVYLPGDLEEEDFGGTKEDTEERRCTARRTTGQKKPRKFPTVLVRTPYGKSVGASVYYRFVQRGYAVVIQDTRGREDSTGQWIPEYYEVEDGDDTLNWIAAQEWSDGQAAMTGGSYLGYVQWAAAASGNPHLKALLSSVTAGSAFVDIPRRGGCFTSGMLAWAFAMSEQRMRPDLMVREDWDEILDIRPLSVLAEKALGHPVPFLEKWLEHRDMDEFWKRSNWRERYQGGPVPALIMSGWFDDNGMGTTEALDLVKSWPKGTWKAVLGPWKHSGNADYDLHGIYLGENALRYDMDLLCMMWLEHFLKGVDNGIEKTPTVEYYTVGENRWKTAESWPVEETKEVICYLDGTEENQAVGTGTVCGAGVLSWEKPCGVELPSREKSCDAKLPSCEKPCGAENKQDSLLYDPDFPSTHIVDMSENELEVPEDYTQEERRRDILTYSTPVLEEPLTITGDALVRIYFSCDCPDTDFVVRITDVDENGRSVKLADGVLGAKYRNGFEEPEYLEPGKIYQADIRTTKISNTFLPGHRMRVTVTCSAKNFIFPNSNTRLGFDSPDKQKAAVTIYRGGEQASWVRLRVEKQADT